MRKGTIKNNVILREKVLKSGNLSLYLDIYRAGTRKYEFLKLYVQASPKTQVERATRRETLALAEQIRTQREVELNYEAHGIKSLKQSKVLFFDFTSDYVAKYTKRDIRTIEGAIRRFSDFIDDKRPKINKGKLLLSDIDKEMILDFIYYRTARRRPERSKSFPFAKSYCVLKRFEKMGSKSGYSKAHYVALCAP